MKTVALIVVAVALTLAYTQAYGALNQATYLLDPLHRAMPELYHRDWFVGTPPYLPVFGWIVRWLYAIDPAGSIAILVVHVIVTVATYAGLYRITIAVSPGARTALIVAGFMTITMGLSMGGSYILGNYFQPSSLATVGWMFAIAALVRRRWLACGIAAALAGAFHANFLVLGIGLFPLAAIAIQRVSLRDVALLLAPQLVLLAFFLPQLIGAAGPSHEAVNLLIKFHAPIHYDPHRQVWAIPELLAWELAAFAALGSINDSAREARALWRFSLVAFAIVAGAALIANSTPWHALVQLRVSRIAPFGQLAAQILVAAAIMSPSRRRIGFEVLAICALLMTCRQWHFGVPTMVLLVACVLLARYFRSGVAVIAIVVALWFSQRGAGVHIEPFGSPTELALETWAREHTATDALFVIPPELGRFRLLSQRAVIVDTKSPPLRPDLLVAWYHRLCALVLVEDAPTFQSIEQRYAQLAPDQLAQVALSFNADYIVVSTFAPQPTGPSVFANTDFAVYRVR